MNAVSWLSVFGASLAGSVHCAAMCGGFVAAYAGSNEGPARRAAAHAAYNGGRLVTYLTLGTLAGALGHALDLAGAALGLAHVAAVVTGAVLIVTGLVSLTPRSGLVRLGRGPSSGPAALLGRLLARFRDKPASVRALVLGLSSTLLPCGWLYAFVAFAAAAGSAGAGAWLMSAFWLGSLPLLVGLGLSFQSLVRRFGRSLPQVRSVLVLAVGAFTLITRMQLPAFAATNDGTNARALGVPTPADCPCHRAHRTTSPPLPVPHGGIVP
jgi:sulfite exporter TauE/SafE